jgi:hypothetical protein
MIPDDSPFKFGKLDALQDALNWVQKTEYDWLLTGDQKDVYTPWMPFQPADFIAIISECVAQVDGPLFLDVGSGPGTKMRLAQMLFGLTVHGIERNPQMAHAAVSECIGDCFIGDALEFSHYGDYDLIWLYRPIKTPEFQRVLEQKIYAEARSGAIVAGGALEHHPEGWITVLDDWDLRRGAWKKP